MRKYDIDVRLEFSIQGACHTFDQRNDVDFHVRMLLPYFGNKVKDIVQVIANVLFDNPNKNNQLLQADLDASRARIAYRMEERWNNL